MKNTFFKFVSISISLLGAGFVPTIAFGSDGKPLPEFKQLCATEQSAGFIWEKGGWDAVMFKPENFVVQKITPPETSDAAKAEGRLMAYVDCVVMGEGKKDQDLGSVKFFNSCLSIRRLDSKNDDFELCEEKHVRDEKSGKWSTSFKCKNEPFYFEPNGWFHTGFIHDQLEYAPEDDYKDSLSVQVGHCISASN